MAAPSFMRSKQRLVAKTGAICDEASQAVAGSVSTDDGSGV